MLGLSRFHLLLPVTCCVVVGTIGCIRRDKPTPAAAGSAATQVAPDTLLESAVELLQSTKRAQAAHRVAAQRLNQYLETARQSGKDLVPPVQPELRRNLSNLLSAAQLQQIESDQFDRPDSLHLENCFLYRDIAEAVTAELRDDRAKVEVLFDWVVRNIQFVPPDSEPPIPLSPRMALILGHGNVEERAWTFMELIRQVGIESVLVAYQEMDSETRRPRYVPWVPAALIDNSLVLFDTTLGLPVPGPEGQGIATLRQILADPALLSALDLDLEHPYRVRPEQLQKLVLLFESSPTYWAPRMQFLQERLSGRNRAVLWSDLVTLAQQTQSACGQEIAQDLWPRPVMVDAKSAHGSDEYMTQVSAVLKPYLFFGALLDARLSQLRGKPKDAIPVYMNNRMPPSPLAERDPQMQEIYEWVREDSTYFLGLVKFEQREYDRAVSWFDKSYLTRYPTGKWAAGARYHLGRCAEAEHDAAKAILYYTSADSSPQQLGNLIRARRLGWKPESPAPTSSDNSFEPSATASDSP